MESIIGVWRLIAETATDAAGNSRPPYYGPKPLAIATFTADGRMIAALSDGRPGSDGPRAHISYCGSYTFDGRQLVTEVDGASDPRMREAPQVRAARFEDGRLVLRPIGGVRLVEGAVRELIWERIA